MKFLIGFLVAVFVVIGFAGVVVADCSCNQDPTVFGGGWGVTPPECFLLGGCSVGVDWQRDTELNRLRSKTEHQPLFYMNPAARDAARVYGGDPNLPVLHADWYDNNPSYFVEWYRTPDGQLPDMTKWNKYCQDNGVGY